MKNALYIGVLLCVTLNSCKKDHTCTCAYTYTDANGFVTKETHVTEYKSVKKNEVSKECVSGTYIDSHAPGATKKEECKLD